MQNKDINKLKIATIIRSTSIYNDSRVLKEIDVLLEENYFVHVLGWNREGNSLEKLSKIFSNEKNINIHLFNNPISGGIGKKNIHLLFAWFRWVKNELKQIEGLELAHICDLDSGIGILRYLKKKKVKIVYDIYDYYIDSHQIPKFLIPIVERLEINLINNADITLICTEERREQIAKSNPKRVVVIHNSPDIAQMPNETVVNDYAYIGSLNKNRLVRDIFENYEDNQDLKFAIGGYGIYSDMAKGLSKKYYNFNYYGSIPYDEVLKLEAKSLALSAIYEPSLRNHRLAAPNKFYEALALGKPIIVCKNTGIDRIVEKYGIGKVIDYHPLDFYNAIRYYKKNPREVKRISKVARKLYDEKYSWKKMKKRLAKVYSPDC